MRRVTGSVVIVGLLALLAGLTPGCGRNKEQALAEHLASAKALSQQGKNVEALAEYRRAVGVDARSGDARHGLALAYLAVGDGARAVQEASRAADLLPQRNDVQLDAGRILLAAGRFEDAADRAKRVLARDLRNVDALVLLGNSSAGLSAPDEIIATIDAAAKELPNEPGLQAVLGGIERRRGNVVEAESSFKNAVSAAPKSVEVHLALANFYWSMGRYAEAEATLKTATAFEGPALVASRNLAFYYTLTSQAGLARPLLEKVVATKADDAVSAFALADIYANEGALDRAASVLAVLLNNPVTRVAATVRMAIIEHRAGKKEAAYKRLAATGGVSKVPAEFSATRARLLLNDGRTDEALEAAQAAATEAPQWAEGHYLLGAVLASRGMADEAVSALKKAEELAPAAGRPKALLATLALEGGDTDAAVNYARDAVRLMPTAPTPRLALARALLRKRDPAGAEAAIQPLMDVGGRNLDVQVIAGSIATLKGDVVGARRAYTTAAEIAPTSFEALAGLVGLELKAGKTSNAMGLVERRLAAAPKDPDLLLLSAEVQLAANNPQQAEAALNKAIVSAPNDMRAYEPLARLYFQQGRLDEAVAKFKALSEKQPKAVAPATMRGIILQLQGKPDEAIKVYEALLGQQSEAPVAANNLALLMVQSGGNIDVALSHAQTAKRLLPNDPNIDDTLGVVFTRKQLYPQAIQSLESSTRADPQNAEYWLHLGIAYAGADRKVDAKRALEKATTVKSASPSVLSEARAALSALK